MPFVFNMQDPLSAGSDAVGAYNQQRLALQAAADTKRAAILAAQQEQENKDRTFDLDEDKLKETNRHNVTDESFTGAKVANDTTRTADGHTLTTGKVTTQQDIHKKALADLTWNAAQRKIQLQIDSGKVSIQQAQTELMQTKAKIEQATGMQLAQASIAQKNASAAHEEAATQHIGWEEAHGVGLKSGRNSSNAAENKAAANKMKLIDIRIEQVRNNAKKIDDGNGNMIVDPAAQKKIDALYNQKISLLNAPTPSSASAPEENDKSKPLGDVPPGINDGDTGAGGKVIARGGKWYRK